MKKRLLVVIIGICIFAVTGCSSGTDRPDNSNTVVDVQAETDEEVNTEPSENDDSTEEKAVDSDKKEDEVDESEVSIDFKEVMDGLEDFFDDYIAIKKKYDEENEDAGFFEKLGDYTEKLGDYSEWLLEYAEKLEELESIDTVNLSEADAAYYILVAARIHKKLEAVE